MYVPYEQICTFIPMYGYIHLVGTTILSILYSDDVPYIMHTVLEPIS
jgi:hypothetical protein